MRLAKREVEWSDNVGGRFRCCDQLTQNVPSIAIIRKMGTRDSAEWRSPFLKADHASSGRATKVAKTLTPPRTALASAVTAYFRKPEREVVAVLAFLLTWPSSDPG